MHFFFFQPSIIDWLIAKDDGWIFNQSHSSVAIITQENHDRFDQCFTDDAKWRFDSFDFWTLRHREPSDAEKNMQKILSIDQTFDDRWIIPNASDWSWIRTYAIGGLDGPKVWCR